MIKSPDHFGTTRILQEAEIRGRAESGTIPLQVTAGAREEAGELQLPSLPRAVPSPCLSCQGRKVQKIPLCP